MSNKKFTYITEFAGAGGACLGLRDAGGECKLMIEFDPYDRNQNAYKHLVLNFPETYKDSRIVNCDITTLSGVSQLRLACIKPGEIDVVQSSSPCQGFSMSNTSKIDNDPRNDLFFHTIENLKITQPKIFIGENVPGLVNSIKSKSKYLQIKKRLVKAGYRVGTWILDSKYYSCPQSRPRVWIIGIRNDIGIEPSVPDYHNSYVAMREVLPHLDGHIRGQFEKDVIGSNFPVSTITKSQGFKVIENGESRYPTVEELRILSTFPDDYKFVEKLDDAEDLFRNTHKRLGNSVLPKMMKVLMDHLYNTVLEPYRKSLESLNDQKIS